MIDFTWPWIFVLLPLPLIVWLTSRTQSSNQNAIRILPSMGSALLELNKERTRWSHNHPRVMLLVLLTVAWIALLIAIAQPHRTMQHAAQPASGRAIVLLIDLSTSMERKDFLISGESVDRLTVVKNAASQFIANRKGDRIGLVLFGSEAFVASPLSYDLNAVNTLLLNSGIGMAGRTTAMGDALGLAIQSLRVDNAREKAIVLLSDGTNNAGSVEPEDAAALAKEFGIIVHTIGLGSDNSNDATQQFQSAAADLDEDTLESIASSAGGEFFRASTTEELRSIYETIDKLQSTDITAPPLIIKRDFRNYFVAIALLCFVLCSLLTVQWSSNL